MRKKLIQPRNGLNLNQWTVVEIANSICGRTVSKLVSEIETTHNVALDIMLSTQSGVTLSVDGSVTGSLKQEIHKHQYWLPNKPGDTFHLYVQIPIFSSSNPFNVVIGYSETEDVQISKHIWFEGFTFALATAPFAVSLDTKLKGQWNKNPTLQFEINGSFKADAGIVLWGAMIGTWPNAFGYKGFNLSNVIAEVGMNPSACAFGCISDLGLGLEMSMGLTTIKFDGNLALPDLWDLYLSGEIDKRTGKQDLAIVDVIDKWNAIDPTKQVSKANISPSWGITKVSFFLAPENGNFGPIHYTRGFGVTGIIELLSMHLFISLNCTGDAFTCNFGFDVSFSIQDFSKMIQHEIGLMYPNMTNTYDIFSLKHVKLLEWSQQNSANNVHPNWKIGITILNKEHDLDFRVKQYELSSSFHDFFKQWLKHLF